jgi:predicted RNase H-like HicB family nuclease
MAKFLVTLEQDEDGFWVAECPALPGCASQGQSKAQALDNIREAIGASLETRAAQGLAPPLLDVVEVEVAGAAG